MNALLLAAVLAAGGMWSESVPLDVDWTASVPDEATAEPLVDLEGPAKGDVQLLVFSANWCGPCREMEPIVAEMQDRDFPVQIVKADERAHAATLRKYKINELPAYILYYEGKPAEWSSGPHSRQWLVDWISRIQTDKAKTGPLTDPLNAEVFREKHWYLSRGTCGMLGCGIHGGGWILR